MSDPAAERRGKFPSDQYQAFCEKEFNGVKDRQKEQYDDLKRGQEKHTEKLEKIEQKIFNGFGDAISRLALQNKRLMGIMISTLVAFIGAGMALAVHFITGG